MGWPVPSSHWARHSAWLCGCTGPGSPLLPSLPPAHSLRHHWDFLPGLLHRPLQLPFTIGPKAAVWQMQVSPCGRTLPSPARPLAHGSARRGPASQPITLSPIPWALRLPAVLPQCEDPSLSHGLQPFWHSTGIQQVLTQCWLGGSQALGAGQNGEAPLSPYPLPSRPSVDAGAEWGGMTACGYWAGVGQA